MKGLAPAAAAGERGGPVMGRAQVALGFAVLGLGVVACAGSDTRMRPEVPSDVTTTTGAPTATAPQTHASPSGGTVVAAECRQCCARRAPEWPIGEPAGGCEVDDPVACGDPSEKERAGRNDLHGRRDRCGDRHGGARGAAARARGDEAGTETRASESLRSAYSAITGKPSSRGSSGSPRSRPSITRRAPI